MSKHVNVGGGLLVLSDGTEVAPGTEVSLTAEHLKNEGVKAMLADGLLAPSTAPEAKAVKAEEPKA